MLNNISSVKLYKPESSEHGYGASGFIFTFVRAPLAHWLEEAATRHYEARAAGKQSVRQSVSRYAAQFVLGCDERVELTTQIASIASAMEGGLLRVNRSIVDFVGHLDDFESEWDRLGVFLLGLTQLTRRTLPSFPKFPADTARPAGPLLPVELDRALVVALCRVLTPDYVCFGYDLPSVCSREIGEHNVTCPFFP